MLAAVRDLEPHERERLAGSGIAALPAGAYSAAGLDAALDDLRGRVGRVYLHVDLDALDPAEGIANRYAAPGGLSAGQVLDALAAVGDRFAVAAVAVTAYEPAADAGGRMPPRASAAARWRTATRSRRRTRPRSPRSPPARGRPTRPPSPKSRPAPR